MNGISIDDELEDFDIANLYGDDNVEKQIVPKPPSYEKSLQDVIKGKKKINMNPDLDLQPPEYDYDDGPDYALDTEDEDAQITIQNNKDQITDGEKEIQHK